MAKYLETFESETIGTVPSNWTPTWDTSSCTWSVETDGGSPSDQFVRVTGTPTLSEDYFLRFDGATLSEQEDVQILAKVRSNAQWAGIVLRGDDSTRDAYVITCFFDSSLHWIYRSVSFPAGGLVAPGAFLGGTIPSNTWGWVKVQILGDVIRVKIWPDGSSEPEYWQGWLREGNISGYNHVGLRPNITSPSDTIDCSVFHVGTNGDPADLSGDEVGLRVTDVEAQAVASLDAETRVTQSGLMTLKGGTGGTDGTGDTRVTQSALLALHGTVSASVRATQSAVLVLGVGVPCITHWTQAWTITRTDGTVFRYTTLDVDLTWRGDTYKTCASLASTASENVVGLSESGNVEINAIINSNNFKDEELLAGWFDGATVEAWVVPWQTDEGEYPFRIFFGLLGQITKGTVSFKADVVTQASIAQQKNLLDIYMPSCRHVLGDSNCGVSLAGLQVSGAVTSITQPTTPGLSRKRVFLDSARTEDDGYFNFGVLTWTTGENAGQSNHVDTSVGSTITLWDACAYRIEIGDQYTMTPGCDKLSDTCKNKFSNFVNFGGFPHIPGKDELIGWRPKATEIR